MPNKFYVTTPIYYVNDIPHIGHAYTTIAADVLARYYRQQGRAVYFLTGTDEHGQKIQTAAKEKNLSPREFVDQLVPAFQKAWSKLNISYDGFIRTTSPDHQKAVQNLLKKAEANGDIYLGEYEGLYCAGCEQYYLEKDLVDNKCPVHKSPVEHLKEPTYFFRLSRYQQRLLDYYAQHPELISPELRRDEILNRVKEGLKDLSISRKNMSWGIPFPLGEGHVVYVWFDALSNYITALGWSLDEKNFNKFWPADVHLIGKEIAWFHCVIWPAMLMSAGIELPHMVYAHGWWTVEGEKMSKTRGNVIDPIKLAEEYGVDPVRYFLLREVPFGQDGNFSIANFRQRFNTDLANDLGNLLNRTLNMCHKYFSGSIPEKTPPYLELDQALMSQLAELPQNIAQGFKKIAFGEVLEQIWSLINKANKYIESSAPWTLAKNQNEPQLKNVIRILLDVLAGCAESIEPFMPETAGKMRAQLNFSAGAGLASGVKINQPVPMFPRLEK